jgi:type I restriction enzyme S subunit
MDHTIVFPRYDSYKDSGVEWIGDIPAHWEIERAKWLFERVERPVRPEDDIVTAFRDGTVTLRSNRRTEGFTTALQEHGYQGIRKGDLVIHAMDAFAGAIGVSDSDGKATPVYAACVNRGEYYTNSVYYAYLLRYMSNAGYIESLAKGIRERSTDFRFNDFAKLYLPIPPCDEQDRIANFLDHKIAEIDEAIAKKQRLIELFKEQKAILINQAVTKGLNPDVPMRDSGVEWIGEVPANWNIKKNSELFLERKESGSESLPILSVSLHTGVSDFEQDETENIRSKVRIEDKTSYRRVYPGDIAFNMMRAWQGAIGVVKTDGQVSPAYIIATPCRLIDGEYFEYQYRISSFIGQMDRFSKGITDFRKRLYWNEFKRLFTIVPPIDEQKKIIAKIREIAISTDQVVEKIDREIEHIREFRSILISTAVTGKIVSL